jgi:hypothetical protein
MKRTLLPVALAALLAPAPLSAERIPVDIEALASATSQFSGASRTAVINGWTIMDTDSYSDTAINIRINRNVADEYIDSPVFAHAITSIELKLKSSAQSDRRLAFIPVYDGLATTDTALWSRCDYSPNKDTYVARTNYFPLSANVRAFRMALDDGGGSTGWGVSEMTIVTTDTDPIAPPTSLQASEVKGRRFTLSWECTVSSASNRIDVFQTIRHEETGSTLAEYDFLAFTNTGKNASARFDKATLQIEPYPEFSGTNVYAAGNSTGVVQISNPDAQGWLRYNLDSVRDSLDSAVNAFLSISAKQHQTDMSSNWKLAVSQVSSDGTTNRTDAIAINGEFPASPFSIQIDRPDTCRAIVMRPSDSTKKNRRILVDSIAIVKDYSPATVETNLVKSVFVARSPATVRGLSPGTEYLVSVSAFDADGNESMPSDPLRVETSDEGVPLSVRIR